ncbi:MAG: serine/threonine-protein kinase, partial [Planctomycetota bacterium]
MTDRWALVRDLVIRALELPATQRRAFVRSECGEDAALAAEVLRVVESRHEAGEDFLEPPEYLISQEPTEKTRFDDFEIVRELGRGGMGTVFLARQNALDRYVALKVFVEGFLTSSSQVERFHREASSVARLSHTGIVPVYASGSDGPTHWYAMEYIAGHDLSQEIARLKEGGSSSAKEGRGFLFAPGEPEHPRAIAKVVAKVAQALQYAHEHGLVHRDVKPQNILLREDGTALLTDFGIARDERFGSLTRSGELQGTPHYMSPEQARVTEATVDHRTDVYSLGVVLYELATLQRPHEGATHAALLADLREREAQPIQRLNPGFPRDLATICEKALRKEPE